MPYKPTLSLDFDGVIHSYTSGWQGPLTISDPPVPGALEFMREAVQHFELCIFSSRSATVGAATAMRSWLIGHARAAGMQDIDWIDRISFPFDKPAAFLSIDDRAICFDGTWPSIATLKAFRPWNRK